MTTTSAKRKKKKADLRLEYRTIAALLELQYAENPKDHDLPELKRSFQRFGFRGALQFDETTQQIEAGHGRLLAAHELFAEGGAVPEGVLKNADGEWMLPILCGTGLKDADEYVAYVIADNYLTQLGGWKDDLMRSIFADFKERKVSFEGIGFSQRQVERILRDLNPEKKVTGKRPDDKLDAFLDATIKMVKIYLPEDEYDGFLDMLDKLGEKWNLTSAGGNSAVIIRCVQDAYVEHIEE